MLGQGAKLFFFFFFKVLDSHHQVHYTISLCAQHGAYFLVLLLGLSTTIKNY